MGHGAAKHILAKGHPLTILGNRNRQPVDDLVARGAREAKNPAAVAAASDVVFLCLPSSVEVERIVLGPDGLAAAMRAGTVLVDATTADPNSTRKLGADLAARGIAMVDGPLGRTPLQAEAGKLSTFLGGDGEAIARVRPIVECYADTIIEAGPLGAGHTLKLINNFISLGTSAIVGEAVATAAKLGVDLRKLYEVVSAGGANSAMFQMMMPWALEGDDSKLRGPFRIGGKDLRAYCRLAEAAPFAAFMAQAASQTYQLVNARGHGDRMIPTLPGILAELNGAKIRDLDP
jgi:3-hydroxyisobutyrate dehydrogenase-like beta-hydroxyacid dehydrogenase